MPLTTQQEAFAQAVVSGDSASDAYRKAYPKSLKWKDVSVWVAACNTAKNDNVKLRISELRSDIAAKCQWSREQSVEILREIALNGDRASDRVAAIKELNSMQGFEAPKELNINAKVVKVELVPLQGVLDVD